MAKHTSELKKKVVQAYVNGEGGYKALAKRYHLRDNTLVRDWVKRYQTYGEAGLLRKRQNKFYAVQTKLDAVELYLTTELSIREIAAHFEVSEPSIVARWLKEYREEGADGFSESKGRPPKMNGEDKKQKKTVSSQSNDEQIQELEKRIRLLQIENAYLKELRRLRQKEQPLQKKPSQESSTASEDTSN